MSISPTFYARLFRTKVSRKTFLYLDFRFVLFLAKNYWRKSRAYIVGEIDISLSSAVIAPIFVSIPFFCFALFFQRTNKKVLNFFSSILVMVSLLWWRWCLYLQLVKSILLLLKSSKTEFQLFRGEKISFFFQVMQKITFLTAASCP